MVKTWSNAEGKDITCDACNSVYAVTIHRLPARDKDSFACTVCGEPMREWNDTVSPSFKLKYRGTPKLGDRG